MKEHTIIFVPHARAKFRKWRLTSLQIAVATGAIALVTLGSLFFTVSYFSTTVDHAKLRQVEQENEELRTVNQGFEKSIRDLEVQLTDYQERIHQLAIVAGLKELSPTREAGIGGTLSVKRTGDLAGTLSSLEQRVQGLDKGMSQLRQVFEERNLMVSSTPAILPVRGLFTSGFGYRIDPFTGRHALHSGLDVVAAPGKEIVVTGDGLVTSAGYLGALGNAVYVSHGYGLATRYGHLSRIAVEAGQRVKRGQVIGYLGNSGRSTGYHLHYEVQVDGEPVNPLSYILDAK